MPGASIAGTVTGRGLGPANITAPVTLMRRVNSGRVEIYDMLNVPQLRHCVPQAESVMRPVRARY